MKKALAILMAFAMVASALFAEGMPAPTLTYGFSGDAEVRMIGENTIDTFKETGTASTPVAKSEPKGLKATKFVAKTWANMDWALASIKTEGKWDAFKSNGDDWSYLKVSTTWKDFFGFKIDYNIALDNKEVGATVPTTTKGNMFEDTNEIVATLDKLSSDGFKFWTKYDADALILMASATAGENADNFLDNFKEIGFEIDNDEFAGKLVYNSVKPVKVGATAASANLDAAQFEAKKLFGVWTAVVNSGDEKKLRVGNLGTDAKTDREEFVVGKDNKLQSNNLMNINNTLTPVENLTIKAFAVAPVADVTVADWLAAPTLITYDNTTATYSMAAKPNLSVAAEYALADVGTIGTGIRVRNDYNVSTGTTSGPSNYLVGYITSKNSAYALTPADIAGAAALLYATPYFGNGFWLDAKLDKALGDKIAVYAGFDAQLGRFYKYTKTTATEVSQIQTGDITKYEVNLEAKITSVDKVELLAGAALRGQMGYSYAKARTAATLAADAPADLVWNDIKKATNAANFYASNWNEANDVTKNILSIKPFELKLKATYNAGGETLSSVWVKNTFTALDSALDSAAVAAAVGGRAPYGFVDKNAVELGMKLKSGAKSSLTISANYNLYLGVPTASNLQLEGATTAAQDALKTAHAAWVSSTFNPFEAKVAYSYAY